MRALKNNGSRYPEISGSRYPNVCVILGVIKSYSAFPSPFRYPQQITSINQALAASASNPIRGVTTDTLANHAACAIRRLDLWRTALRLTIAPMPVLLEFFSVPSEMTAPGSGRRFSEQVGHGR
jgi:hypothetical protein